MRAVDVLERLELLGSSQWSLVTAAQAQRAGVSKVRLARLVGSGTLQRVRHGVYSLPSAGVGPLQGLRAAWLSTNSRPAGENPQAVVSGEAAAVVHGLGDLLPSKYEFTTAVRRQTSHPDIRYRKLDLPVSDVTVVDGLPVTTVARTVADLAVGGTDFDHLAGVVGDAFLTRDVQPARLADALEPAAKRFGHSNGRSLLTGLLEASGYRPNDLTLNVVTPEIQERFARALAPRLQDVIDETVASQLAGLLPKDQVDQLVQRIAGALRPQTEDHESVSTKEDK